MAGTRSQSSRLSYLRALAQSHLSEIESEKVEEQVQLSQAEAEIQRYSKMSSYDRKKLASGNAQSADQRQQPLTQSISQDSSAMDVELPVSTKKNRLRPFPEILHRLRWDPTLNINDYEVGYLERFEGIKEMPASNWIRDFSDEDWIPMHRVRYVKRVRCEEKSDAGPEVGVVWDRDGRVDLFGAIVGDTNEEAKQSWEGDVISLDGTSMTGGVSV